MPGVRCGSDVSYAAGGTDVTGLNATAACAYSFTAWCYDEGLTGYPVLFVQESSVTNSEGIRIALGGGTIGYQVRVADASAQVAVSGSGLFYNSVSLRKKWFHLGITWDGAVVCFYYNGLLYGRAGLVATPTTGGTRRTSINAAYGRMFDVRVFPNITLRASEVLNTLDPRRLVSGCAGRYFVTRGAREATSALVVDESGNGNNLLSDVSYGRGTSVCEEPPWRDILSTRAHSPLYFRRRERLHQYLRPKVDLNAGKWTGVRG